MKKVTIFKEGSNVGAVFYDGNKRTEWDKLTRDEQIDLLEAMRGMYNLFLMFVKEEEARNEGNGTERGVLQTAWRQANTHQRVPVLDG